MSSLPLFLSKSYHSVTISTIILIYLTCTTELNLEGLTLDEGGMTLNLDTDMAAISILDWSDLDWQTDPIQVPPRTIKPIVATGKGCSNYSCGSWEVLIPILS